MTILIIFVTIALIPTIWVVYAGWPRRPLKSHVAWKDEKNLMQRKVPR